jgi:hypothetical protein
MNKPIKPRKPYIKSDEPPPDSCSHKVYKMFFNRFSKYYFVEESKEALISFGKDIFNKTPDLVEEFYKISENPKVTTHQLIDFIVDSGNLGFARDLCKDNLTALVEHFKDTESYELGDLNEDNATFDRIYVHYKKSEEQYNKEVKEWENRDEIYKQRLIDYQNELKIYNEEIEEYKKFEKIQYKKRLEEKLKLLNEELG